MIRALIPWYLRQARHPLKDKIVGRYWGWFSREPLWIDYDDGLRVKLDLNDYLQQKVFYDGYYERVVVDWLKAHLRGDDVLWDVGANVGVMTLVAARRCARVIAFEPEPLARRRLEENIAMNAIGNVTVMPFALGPRDGSARMRRGPAINLGMSRLARDGEDGDFEAKIRAADDVAREGVPVPDVMKVDVEGGELGVFQGARNLLAESRLRAAVFESSESGEGHGGDGAAIGNLLREFRFVTRELGRSDIDARDGKTNFVAQRP